MELVIAVIAALSGALLFEALGVPAGALVGSMLAIAALRIGDVEVPQIGGAPRFVTYAAVGWLLGQAFSPDFPRVLVRAAVPMLAIVGVLLAVAGIIAWVLVATGTMDPSTALLAASPGGISQMGIFSEAARANVELVVTVHLLRVLAIVVLVPLVVARLPSG